MVGYSLPSGWSVRGTLGGVIGGSLEDDDEGQRFDMSPGVIGSVSGARRWSLGSGFVVMASLAASAATFETTGDTTSRLTALDFRLGATAGRTFADLVTPYLLARGFGGPVFWSIAGEDVVGTDTRKFQLGAGVGVHTGFGFDAIVDVSVLGEQSASIGIGWQI